MPQILESQSGTHAPVPYPPPPHTPTPYTPTPLFRCNPIKTKEVYAKKLV